MRVGIEVTATTVTHTSSSITWTVRYYTENQYSYNDNQTLNLTGNITGSVGYHNGEGSGTIQRSSQTLTYNYTTFGSSPGSRTFGVNIPTTYNGSTTSASVTVTIPARPYGAPAAVTSIASAWVSDSQINTTWTNQDTTGEPYDDMQIQIWDNVTNGWGTAPMIGYHTGYSWTSLVANRRYQFRVRPKNSIDWGSWATAGPVQTTPTAPTGAAVSAASTTSVNITWTNQATTQNGYQYDTCLEESVNGGAWNQFAIVASGVSSYVMDNRTPGATYQYRVRARSTVGTALYTGYSTSGTIQLMQAPAAPSGVSATYNSDTQATITWTNNPSGSAPYTTLSVFRYDTASNTTVAVASGIAGTTTSFTDTGIVANNNYAWSIRAENAAGNSSATGSNGVVTTPSVPTNLAITRVSNGVQLTWTNNERTGNYTTNVRYYTNGSVTDSSIIVGAGVTSYTLTGVSLSNTYAIGVRAKATDSNTLYSAWVDSATIAAAVAPNAPVSLSPNGSIIDLARSPGFTWQHVASVDGSAQTAFQVQHRVQGAGSWTQTGKITSTTSSWTLPPGTYTNGTIVEWQVQTWGVAASAGSFSASATVTGSSTPTVSITSPTATITSSTITASWNYGQAQSSAQAAWIARLYDAAGATLLEEISGTNASTSITFAHAASDGELGQVRVQAQSSVGIWSDWASVNYQAVFTPPAASDLSTAYDDSVGATVLSLTPGSTVTPGTLTETNLCTNPSFETNTTGWAAVGTSTIAQSSAQAWIGTKSLSVVMPASAAIGAAGVGFSLGSSLTVSSQHTWSAYVYNPTGASLMASASGAGVASSPQNGTAVAAGAGWQRVSVTFTTTGSAAAVTVYILNATAVGGSAQTIYVDAALPQKSATLNAYFDGSTLRDATYYYEWSGTANGSVSNKKLIGSVAASSVSIQRAQLASAATDISPATWGDWETIAVGVAPNATLIDPTAHIVGEGRYRAVTYSAAPSSKAGAPLPSPIEARFLYVNYGANFAKSVRLWANIDIKVTASRDRALHKFAGRAKPVAFYGEGTDLLYDVSAILDDDSSSATAWETMGKEAGTVLLRDPTGRRIYGSIGQVAIQRLSPDLSSIAFTVQEVSFP